MHQLKREMSKIISVEDDLVSNEELNPKIQTDRIEVREINSKVYFSIDFTKLWNKRWKLLSCCLCIHIVIILIVVCVLATNYVDLKRKLRTEILTRRMCKDVCKYLIIHNYFQIITRIKYQ